MRIFGGIVLLVLAQALAGCGGFESPAAPLVPSPVPQPIPQPTPPLDDDAFIKGVVYDTANRPLAGATVEVLDGPQAGTAATADAKGEFSLTGTFDDTTRVRATKEGHVAATGTLKPSCAICHPHRWIYFYLDVLAPPVNMAGDYTLTLIADTACAALPNEVRTRTYAATIAAASYRPNTSFDLTASGAPFLENYQSVQITVAGDYVAFWIGGHDHEAGLVERVAANTYLAFDGWAAASVGTAESTISTSFDGRFDYCALKSEMGTFYDCSPTQAVARAQCQSKNHRLILTRR